MTGYLLLLRTQNAMMSISSKTFDVGRDIIIGIFNLRSNDLH